MKRKVIITVVALALMSLGGFLFYFFNGFFYHYEGYVNYVGQSDWDITYRFDGGRQITYSHDEAGIINQFLEDHYSQPYYAGYYIRQNGSPGRLIYLWWDDPRYGLSQDGPKIRIVVEKAKYEIGNTLVSFEITEEGEITPRMG